MRMLTPFWSHRNLTPDLWKEMDRMLDDFGSNQSVYDEREFSPASEISESEDHYMLSLDVPGIKREDIHIEVNDSTLTVSGERKSEHRTEDKKFQRYEKSYGSFKRSFVLPSTIDAEKIEARYEDGVLDLYLPKTVGAKARKIEIQSGKGQTLVK